MWHRLCFLLHDGIDDIGTEGRGIVTIVIADLRQMQGAAFGASLQFTADAVLELQQRPVGIELPGERVCRLDLDVRSGAKLLHQLRGCAVERADLRQQFVQLAEQPIPFLDVDLEEVSTPRRPKVVSTNSTDVLEEYFSNQELIRASGERRLVLW